MENEVKEAAPKYNFLTPREYLEMERASGSKNEYYFGQVLSMSGASLKHNIIERNLIASLHTHLRGKDCQVLPSQMRVTTPSREAYMYPDCLIVCGEPKIEDTIFDTLLSPAVIFEILSPTTSGIDKGRKFFYYQKIPSLQEYIMIDSQKKFIQVASKGSDGRWNFGDIMETDEIILIDTINYELPLRDIYFGTGI